MAFQVPQGFFQVFAPAFFLVPPDVFEGVAEVEVEVLRKPDALEGAVFVIARVGIAALLRRGFRPDGFGLRVSDRHSVFPFKFAF
ncbi:hypothetical protein M717_09765 [Neisseria gonorrhoeae SK33414]|nr:hypothetical protein M717_09765 [Neisseria gonorrhoeae SK33414]